MQEIMYDASSQMKHQGNAQLDDALLKGAQVPGMAYVPAQSWGTPYPLAQGFRNGTVFPVLNKPFAPKGRVCK